MPKMGVSSDWIEERETEIAEFITAREHVERLRQLGAVLLRRGLVTAAYHEDMLDSLDYIAGSLLVGKRNTALLRNRQE